MYIQGRGFSEFHKKFFIIINLAIGGRPYWNWNLGTYEERDASVVPIVNETDFPQTLCVDWIRVYKAKDMNLECDEE